MSRITCTLCGATKSGSVDEVIAWNEVHNLTCPAMITNLDRAADIITAIDRARAVQRELKSAFARSGLDGGAKAALNHPLYLDAQDELDRLHDALMILT